MTPEENKALGQGRSRVPATCPRRCDPYVATPTRHGHRPTFQTDKSNQDPTAPGAAQRGLARRHHRADADASRPDFPAPAAAQRRLAAAGAAAAQKTRGSGKRRGGRLSRRPGARGDRAATKSRGGRASWPSWASAAGGGRPRAPLRRG